MRVAPLLARRSGTESIDSRERRCNCTGDEKSSQHCAPPSHRRQSYRSQKQSSRVAGKRHCARFPTPRQQAVVRNYLFKIFDKLGVSTRVELVLYCLQEKPLPGQLAS